MRTIVFAAVVLTALSIAGLGSAKVPPTPVTIDSIVTKPSVGTATATFSTTGLLCPQGTLVDSDASNNPDFGETPAPAVNIQVTKLFTCADGSGTFTLKLQVHIKFDPDFSQKGTWAVTGGTGRYAGLIGSGTTTSEVLSEGDPRIIHDSYVGKVALG